MYIPFIKRGGKCVGQLSYGFNIHDKLEGWSYENQNPYGDLDFFILGSKIVGINGRVHMSNFASFHNVFLNGILL